MGIDIESIGTSDLNNQSDLESFRVRFMNLVDRSQIAAAAEELAKSKNPNDGASAFRNYSGGLIGFTLRLAIANSIETQLSPNEVSVLIDSLAMRLTKHYGFSAEWAPPRMLIRQMTALAVRQKQLARTLAESVGEPEAIIANLDCLETIADKLATPADAYLLSDSQVDELLENL